MKNGINNQQRVWLSRCIFRRPVSVIQDLFQDNDHVKICAEVLKNGKVKSRDPYCYKNSKESESESRLRPIFTKWNW